MSYKINVILTKEIDLPDDAFEGEACHLDIDLDPRLLVEDPDELKHRFQACFKVCTDAISNEMRQHQQNSNRDTTDSRLPRPKPGVPSRGASARSDGMTNSHRTLNSSPALSGRRAGNIAHAPASAPFQDEPATRGQRRAIKSICDRLNLAPSIAASNHHCNFGAVTKRQASLLIRQLRGLERNPTQAECYLGLCTNLNRAEPAKGAGGGAHCHCRAACS